MRYLNIVLLLMIFVCQNLDSQTKSELENALMWTSGEDGYKGKIDTAQMLLNLDPLNESAIDFIINYYTENGIDSISTFFDKLIIRNSQKPEPYLIRAKYLGREFLSKSDSCAYDSILTTKKEFYLTRAFELDSNNFSTNVALAELYYFDFLKPTFVIPFIKIKCDIQKIDKSDTCYKERQRFSKKSFFSDSAKKALFYLRRVQILMNDSNYIYYFPINQLEKYLYNSNPPTLDSLNSLEFDFLPPWYFATLNNMWASDLTINYINSIEWSSTGVEDFKKCLKYFKEENLYYKNIAKDSEIFRAIWLRSFDMPILFRIEKNDNSVWLFWKYPIDSIGEHLITNSRLLSKKEWVEFNKLFRKTEFDRRDNERYIPTLDGSSWILERKTQNKYKVHKNNMPDDKLKKCLYYFIQLSGLEISKDRIY